MTFNESFGVMMSLLLPTTFKSGGEEGVVRGGVVRRSGEGPKECEEGSGEEGTVRRCGEKGWLGSNEVL